MGQAKFYLIRKAFSIPDPPKGSAGHLKVGLG